MFSQICSFTQWFFALTTLWWLLARVSPQVSLSKQQLNWMSCCLVHTCSSLHCEWAYESSDFQPNWMISRILHTCEPSLQSVPADVFSDPLFTEWFSHWVHLCNFSSACVCKWVLIWETWLNDLLHSVHLWVSSPLWVLRFPDIFSNVTMIVWNNIIGHHASNQMCTSNPLQLIRNLMDFWCILM